MYISTTILLLAVSACAVNGQPDWQNPRAQRNHLSGVSFKDENTPRKSTSLQIPFVENQGQIKETNVLYYTQVRNGIAYITATGEIIYSLPAALSPNLRPSDGTTTNEMPIIPNEERRSERPNKCFILDTCDAEQLIFLLLARADLQITPFVPD